jgi:hypothetical protein
MAWITVPVLTSTGPKLTGLPPPQAGPGPTLVVGGAEHLANSR